MTKTAIILTAGLGSRLRPLTNDMPKSLSEVNGKTMLTNTLDNLNNNGIMKVVIVIGYCGDKIKLVYGNRYKKMDIVYIENTIYEETNSMYSLWLAREYLSDECLIIEGDIVSEDSVIALAVNSDDKSYWVCDRFKRWNDGSMQTTDKNNRIIEVRIVRESLQSYKQNYYKSTGILKLSASYAKKLSRWLDEGVQDNKSNLYYDLIIAEKIMDDELFVLDISGMKWYEIDNIKDLEEAEKLFYRNSKTELIKNKTKYVVLIADGMADRPLEKLSWKTPLEFAHIPNMDNVVLQGKTGLMQTIYQSLPVGSIVAILGILGYNPARFYPNGRASFEAIAKSIFLREDDLALRCNLISLENGCIKDFTAGMISDLDAKNIIENLSIDESNIKLYPCQSYRNLMLLKNVGFEAKDLITHEPHSNIGKNVNDLKISGINEKSNKLAETLNYLLDKSIGKISELNSKFKTKADMIWAWSPSSVPILPRFRNRYGVKGSIVCGIDFLRGIGITADMETEIVPGATGDIDTSLLNKLMVVKKFLNKNDLVVLHYNAPDEAAHQKDPFAKVKSLERFDKEIVGPIHEFLKESYGDDFRLAILPDHYTYSDDGTHGIDPVPYVIYGKEIKPDDVSKFDESEIRKNSENLMISYEFMDFLLFSNMKK